MKEARETNKTFGTNLKRIRWHERKMTQRQLAHKANITTASISLIETFKREGLISTARKLAKALDVKVSVLIEEPVNGGRSATKTKSAPSDEFS